jgi:hypothetical protein
MARKNFGIPDNVLLEIRERDKECVYCHKIMVYPYVAKNSRDCATIEHLSSDPPFYWSEGLQAHDIVICCGSCNSSRGVKKLADWFKSPYCVAGNINENTVDEPVKSYLKRQNIQNL